ncbi:hypothetical protein [Streptomyces sp. NPDC058751]|uniref:hypothetical protein n=1 Tax=Streptomyces sp. NPDC058751 TaxID=3346623 RepID=UPI0036D012FB
MPALKRSLVVLPIAAVLAMAGIASVAGCDGATGGEPAAAVPAAGPTAALPGQVGKSLPAALYAAVTAHYG